MNSSAATNYFPVELGGHSFVLLPNKALFWPLHRMLIIADAHIGKISHFRKAGASLPLSASHVQLCKFDLLLSSINPDTVVFLGDLFHSELNSEWSDFTAILRSHSSKKFILVQGNHDVLHKNLYHNAEIDTFGELYVDGIRMTHQPITPDAEQYVVCGHIHPGYLLAGRGRQRLRLPCLWKGNQMAVLPAYGDFTGLHLIMPNPGESVFLFSGNKISRIDF